MLRDLDSDRFAARGAAIRGLSDLRARSKPGLRAAWKAAPTAEARQQLGDLLKTDPQYDADTLRALRAIQILERIGAEVVPTLEALAGGAESSQITQDVRAALQRLSRK